MSAAPALALRLVFAYVALFTVVGVWMPYWQVWLADRGFGTATVGWIVSLSSWARVVANPSTAWISSRYGLGRKWLRLLTGLTLLGYFAFYLCESAFAVGILAFIVGLSYAPIGSLLDALAIANAQHGKVEYGRVRLWGSLSFVGTSWVMGTLLGWLPDASILPACCIALLLSHLAMWLLPSSAYDSLVLPQADASPSPPHSLRALCKVPGVVLTIILASLLNASHTLLYGFGTLIWRDDGLAQGQIGWLWAEAVIAEVVLFWLAARCFRGFKLGQRTYIWGPTLFLLASACGGVVRWTMMAHTAWFPALVVLQLLHALTFGAQHVGYVELLSRILEPRQMPAIMTLSTAILSGLTLGVATPLAGLLCDHFGRTSYWAMSGISMLACIVAVIVHRRLGQLPSRRYGAPISA